MPPANGKYARYVTGELLKAPPNANTVTMRSPAAMSTNNPTAACSRLASIFPSRSAALAVAVLREHLEVIQFLRDRGFGDAVQKLAHFGLRTVAHLFGRSHGDHVAFVDENHAIRNQESAGEFVSHDDNRHFEGFFEFEDKLVDTRRNNRVESG